MVNRMLYVYFSSEIMLKDGNMSVVPWVYSLGTQVSPEKDIHIVLLLVLNTHSGL